MSEESDLGRLKRNPGFGVEILLPMFLQDKLAKLPEHGMGYQIVTAITKDGRRISECIVSGGQVIVMPDGFVGVVSDVELEDVRR
jgi:hypothetical protein